MRKRRNFTKYIRFVVDVVAAAAGAVVVSIVVDVIFDAVVIVNAIFRNSFFLIIMTIDNFNRYVRISFI